MSTSLNTNLTNLLTQSLPKNISDQLTTAKSVLQYVSASLISIQSDYQTALTDSSHAAALLNTSQAIEDTLSSASDDLQAVETLVNNTNSRLWQAEQTVMQLTDESVNLSITINQTLPVLDQVNGTISTSRQQLEATKQNISQLTSHLDSASGSGSGEGDLLSNREFLSDKLRALLSDIGLTQSVLDQSYQQLLNAVMHSSSLQTEATYICS